jgi:hypothetical protein
MIDHTLNKAVAGNYDFLVKRLANLDPSQKWQVKVRPYKSTRSIEQNSRLWDLYTAIGKYIGEESDAVHELMGYKFLRTQRIVNGEAVEAIRSTTKLNTQEMVDYQDAIERWAASIRFIWGEA